MFTEITEITLMGVDGTVNQMMKEAIEIACSEWCRVVLVSGEDQYVISPNEFAGTVEKL